MDHLNNFQNKLLHEAFISSFFMTNTKTRLSGPFSSNVYYANKPILRKSVLWFTV